MERADKKALGGKRAGKRGRLAALFVPLGRAKCPFPVPACSGANREWAGCCAHGLPPALQEAETQQDTTVLTLSPLLPGQPHSLLPV